MICTDSKYSGTAERRRERIRLLWVVAVGLAPVATHFIVSELQKQVHYVLFLFTAWGVIHFYWNIKYCLVTRLEIKQEGVRNMNQALETIVADLLIARNDIASRHGEAVSGAKALAVTLEKVNNALKNLGAEKQWVHELLTETNNHSRSDVKTAS